MWGLVGGWMDGWVCMCICYAWFELGKMDDVWGVDSWVGVGDGIEHRLGR